MTTALFKDGLFRVQIRQNVLSLFSDVSFPAARHAFGIAKYGIGERGASFPADGYAPANSLRHLPSLIINASSSSDYTNHRYCSANTGLPTTVDNLR